MGRQARYEAAGTHNLFIGAAGDTSITNAKGEVTVIRDSIVDGVSTLAGNISAISKAEAINAASESTGVRAITNQTELKLNDSVTAVTLDGDSYVYINNVKVTGFAIEDNDASGTLVDGINAVSDETGVIASLDAESKLILTAEDGRNIDAFFTDVASEIGHDGNAIDNALRRVKHWDDPVVDKRAFTNSRNRSKIPPNRPNYSEICAAE